MTSFAEATGPITLLLPGLRMSRRVLIGANEKHSFVGKRELRRTIQGKAVALRPAHGDLYAVDLSNSGDNVWLPRFDRLRTGDLVTLHSCIWQTCVLSPGETTIGLWRDPIPGIVRARDLDDPTTPVGIVSVNGRVVTIAPRSGYTTVHWRMGLHCMVASSDSSGDVTGRAQAWSLSLEEANAQ